MSHENLNEQYKKLEKFRKEIQKIFLEEKRHRKTADFMNTPEFEPGELTADDLDIWTKTENDTITFKEFDEYRERVKKDDKQQHSATRYGFLSLVGNMVSAVIGRRWLEEEKKKRNE